MNFIWVTKFITNKEWEESYQANSSYTLIEKVRGGYKAGFLVAGTEVPQNCYVALPSEIKKIALDRKSRGVLPRPEIKENIKS